MRFASYRRSGIEAVGLIEGDRVLDLSPLYPTMQAVIEAGEDGLEAVRRQRDGAASDWMNLEDVQLTAPPPRPRRCLFCVGLNYEEHFKEGDAFRQGIHSLPEYPAFFSKATETVIGPGEPIGWPGICPSSSTTRRNSPSSSVRLAAT